MRETYFCPDGRQVSLGFNDDTLTVSATDYEGSPIAYYQVLLVGPGGEEVDPGDDAGEAAWFRLEHDKLLACWRNQGITERAIKLVVRETSLLPLIQRSVDQGQRNNGWGNGIDGPNPGAPHGNEHSEAAELLWYKRMDWTKAAAAFGARGF